MEDSSNVAFPNRPLSIQLQQQLLKTVIQKRWTVLCFCFTPSCQLVRYTHTYFPCEEIPFEQLQLEDGFLLLTNQGARWSIAAAVAFPIPTTSSDLITLGIYLVRQHLAKLIHLPNKTWTLWNSFSWRFSEGTRCKGLGADTENLPWALMPRMKASKATQLASKGRTPCSKSCPQVLSVQFHKSLSIVLVAPAQNQGIYEAAVCLPETKIPYLENINYSEQHAKRAR